MEIVDISPVKIFSWRRYTESTFYSQKKLDVHLDLDLLKNYLNGSSKTSWKTQVYIVDSSGKMYIEITYKLILQVTNLVIRLISKNLKIQKEFHLRTQ